MEIFFEVKITLTDTHTGTARFKCNANNPPPNSRAWMDLELCKAIIGKRNDGYQVGIMSNQLKAITYDGIERN